MVGGGGWGSEGAFVQEFMLVGGGCLGAFCPETLI